MFTNWWVVVIGFYIAMIVHESGHIAMARLLDLRLNYAQFGSPVLIGRQSPLRFGLLPIGEVDATWQCDVQQVLGLLGGVLANGLGAVLALLLGLASLQFVFIDLGLALIMIGLIQLAYFAATLLGFGDGSKLHSLISQYRNSSNLGTGRREC